MAATISRSQSHVAPSSSTPFLDPAQAQENFSSQFDLEDPMAAISSYARIMREHTQRQMDLANRAASRRSPNRRSPDKTVSSMANLSAQTSLESTDSRGNA
ncbi:hypothetical protein MMC30_004054 [Trapelia coarctata]|nr:hypothetical protein [Trapelia coarctata]